MAAVAEAVRAEELLAREAARDVGDAVLALIICGGRRSVAAMGMVRARARMVCVVKARASMMCVVTDRSGFGVYGEG